MSRPPGEFRKLLLQACMDLQGDGKAPTLRELAHYTLIGEKVATRTVDNLRRAGLVRVARTRSVNYRSRPVAEYEIAPPERKSGHDALRRAMGW